MLKIVLGVLALFILPLILSTVWQFFYRKIVKKESLPHIQNRIRKRSKLIRIYYDFPKQYVDDCFSKLPDTFEEKGLHLIVGEQGSGKTISLVHLLMSLQYRYPKCKVRTNMLYKHEDGVINSWQDLVFENNGIYGEIDVLDEIQNWFNSLESKDFPIEMFQEISQQRKQRKMIVGTAQVWQRVAKPIREQCAFVYKPITAFGCLTIVRKYKPKVNEDGSVEKLQLREMYFFVHNSEIRDSFDTYHKIKSMSLKGFKSESDRLAFKQSATAVKKDYELPDLSAK